MLGVLLLAVTRFAARPVYCPRGVEGRLSPPSTFEDPAVASARSIAYDSISV